MPGIDAKQWKAVQQVLDELESVPLSQRAARLLQLPVDDLAVRQEVESLIAAESRVGEFLQASPLAEGPATGPVPMLAAGTRLGSFEVDCLIGRGGMAEVYRARRVDDFEQVVAIKLISSARHGRSEYFQRERRIVAAMEHPGIARIVDGGVSADGHPYMVMEYVEGTDIVRHAALLKLDLAARLDLFRQVCAAVSFAHQHLVIHRDLKPGNIRVTPQGQVKLLDFGVAKLLDAKPRGDDFETATVLTPEFAAPEQLYGETVTTATDVYGLGAVLYQLLTGVPPFETRGQPLHLAIDRLLHSKAPLPSVMAAQRGVDSPIPAQQLRGDMDAIVTKAMRRKPADRYASAAELSAELGRFLLREPVQARRGGAGYVLSRLLVRHRRVALLGGVGLVATLIAVSAVVWQARRAESEARRAERVRDFLVAVFDQADPGAHGGQALTAERLLENSSERVAHDLAAEPQVQAELYAVLGRLRFRLGQYRTGLGLADQALALRESLAQPMDPGLAQALMLRGQILNALHREREAIPSLERALQIYERHPERLQLARAEAQAELGLAYGATERRPESLRMLQNAFDSMRAYYGDARPQTARVELRLALALEMAGRYAEAERHYRQSLEALRASYGEMHAEVAEVRRELGGLLDRMGRSVEALSELQQAAVDFRALYGSDHPELAATQFSLAILMIGSQRYAEADALLRDTLRIYPADSYLAAQSQRYLGISELAQDHPERAEAPLQRAVEGFLAVAGENDLQLHRARADLATALLRQGRATEAEALLAQAVNALERLAGPASYELRIPMKRWAECLLALSRDVEAIDAFTRARSIEVALLGPMHRDLFETDLGLATALLHSASRESLTRARRILDAAIAAERPRHRPDELARAVLLSAQIARAQDDRVRSLQELALARPDLQRADDQRQAASLWGQWQGASTASR